METRLDTAEGDEGGEGKDDAGGGETHSADTRSDTQNLAHKDKFINISK